MRRDFNFWIFMPSKILEKQSVSIDPMMTRPFRLLRTRRDTDDTFTIELMPAEGGSEFAFQPGQFNMLYVFGVGEVPISISGDPGKTNGIGKWIGEVTHIWFDDLRQRVEAGTGRNGRR